MIELDFELPLAAFKLRAKATLPPKAVAVVGPSGAGKTSLLESIAGLRLSARGRISVMGEVFLDSTKGIRLPPERRRVGYVPQAGLLFPHLDVLGNLRFGRRGPEPALLEQIIELLDLATLLPRRPEYLSGGEKQRVALGRALATRPAILLLDEPFAALHVGFRQRLFPHLLKIRDEMRVPILYVTHAWGEARALAQAALVLEAGQVVQSGEASQILVPDRAGAIDPDGGWDNLIEGAVEVGADGRRSLVGPRGERFSVPAGADAAGTRAIFAVAPDDVLIATEAPSGLSARNVFPAEVLSIAPAGADAFVELSLAESSWFAKVTAASVSELGLTKGRRVFAAIKTQAFRRIGSTSPRAAAG